MLRKKPTFKLIYPQQSEMRVILDVDGAAEMFYMVNVVETNEVGVIPHHFLQYRELKKANSAGRIQND